MRRENSQWRRLCDDRHAGASGFNPCFGIEARMAAFVPGPPSSPPSGHQDGLLSAAQMDFGMPSPDLMSSLVDHWIFLLRHLAWLANTSRISAKRFRVINLQFLLHCKRLPSANHF
jgi:hypothetical protein